MKQKPKSVALQRVIISGGGTGGHIHPAVAIADEIKHRHPDCEIPFKGYGSAVSIAIGGADATSPFHSNFSVAL